MSWRSTLRALPTMTRVGLSEAVAYRAELLVWVLSTTMPLIMMALWTAVAREAPVGRFGADDFVGYFLAAFVVRQLVSAWAAWEINFEVRQGTLSMRLLRPVSPLWAYAVANLAAAPLRLVVVLPAALVSLAVVGERAVPQSLFGWATFLVAVLGGWLISFFANVALGTLAFFMESSLKAVDLWLVLFFVFSGYLYPVELFPPGLRLLAEWLPFRYLLALPVELMTNMHAPREALGLLARQWAWVALMMAGALLMWRRGLRRFGAFGG